MEQTPDLNVLEEVKKLVSIPSITGSEGRVMSYLETRFKGMKCRVKTFEAALDRPNVYAEFGGRHGEKPALLFHGHLDTVAGFGMKNPFIPQVKEGNLFGRGTADQKAGVAAVITAFERILRDRLPDKPVAFVGVIDEESEHRGSMALKEMGVDADFAVITEPSDLLIGVGCKGTLPLLLEVSGQAAHGCRPWLGKNAVTAAMKAAEAVMALPLPEMDLPGLNRIRGSINLGRMEGGEAYNMVPDRASVWFDRRLLPGESQDEVMKRIRDCLNTLPDQEGHSYSCRVARPDWDWEPIQKRGLHPAMTDLDSPQFAGVKAVHQKVFAREPGVFFTDGYHEMDFLINDLGINAVHYGPGLGALCHTDHEHVNISQLVDAVDAYEQLIRYFCYS